MKRYATGAFEPKHYHKVAPEVTVIVSGEAVMNGRHYSIGDIVLIEPGEITDFEALTDVVTVVVKLPSVPGDKFTC